MTIGSKEHYDVLEAFEQRSRGFRLDREEKSMWKKGYVYQSGETNERYRAFLEGYSFARCLFKVNDEK